MKRILAPTYFLSALVLSVLLHFFAPVRQVIFFPWTLIGIAPLVFGIVLNICADRALKLQQTTVKPFEKSKALVTGGVFKISRNPMYLGMTVILIGVGVLLGSVTPWVVAAVLAVVFNKIFIKPEEQMLDETFGESYRKYQKQVRRWI